MTHAIDDTDYGQSSRYVSTRSYELSQAKIRELDQEFSDFCRSNWQEYLLTTPYAEFEKKHNKLFEARYNSKSSIKEDMKKLWANIYESIRKLRALFNGSVTDLSSAPIKDNLDLEIIKKIIKERKIAHLPQIILETDITSTDVPALAEIAQRTQKIVFKNCHVGKMQEEALQAAFQQAQAKSSQDLTVTEIDFLSVNMSAEVFHNIISLLPESPERKKFVFGAYRETVSIHTMYSSTNILEVHQSFSGDVVKAFIAHRKNRPWDVCFKNEGYTPELIPEDTKTITIEGQSIQPSTIQSLAQDFSELKRPIDLRVENIAYIGNANAADLFSAILVKDKIKQLSLSNAFGASLNQNALLKLAEYIRSNPLLETLDFKHDILYGVGWDAVTEALIDNKTIKIQGDRSFDFLDFLKTRNLYIADLDKHKTNLFMLIPLLKKINEQMSSIRIYFYNSEKSKAENKDKLIREYEGLAKAVLASCSAILSRGPKWGSRLLEIVEVLQEMSSGVAFKQQLTQSLVEGLISNFWPTVSSSATSDDLQKRIGDCRDFIEAATKLKAKGWVKITDELLKRVGDVLVKILLIAHGVPKPRIEDQIAETILEEFKQLELVLALDPASRRIIHEQISAGLVNDNYKHLLSRFPTLEAYLLGIENTKNEDAIYYQIGRLLSDSMELLAQEAWQPCIEKLLEVSGLLAKASTSALNEYFSKIVLQVANGYKDFYIQDKSDERPLKKPQIIGLLIQARCDIRNAQAINELLFEFYKIRVMRAIALSLGKWGKVYGVNGLLEHGATLSIENKISEKIYSLIKDIKLADDLSSLSGAVEKYIAEEGIWGKWVVNSYLVRPLSHIKAEMDDLVLAIGVSQKISSSEPIVTAGESSGEPAAKRALEVGEGSSSQVQIVEDVTGIQTLINELAALEPPSVQGKAEAGAWLSKWEEQMPREYICPITQEIIRNPALAADGHAYEEGAIKEYIAKADKTKPVLSPWKHIPLAHLHLCPCDYITNGIKEKLREFIAQAKKEQAQVPVTVQQEKPPAFNFEVPELELQEKILTPGAPPMEPAHIPVPKPDSDDSISVVAYDPALSQGELAQAKAVTPGEGPELNLPPKLNVEKKPPVSVFDPSIPVFEQNSAVKPKEVEKNSRDAVSAGILTQEQNPGFFSADKHEQEVANLLAQAPVAPRQPSEQEVVELLGQAPTAPQQTLVVEGAVKELEKEQEKRQQLRAT